MKINKNVFQIYGVTGHTIVTNAKENDMLLPPEVESEKINVNVINDDDDNDLLIPPA